MPGPEVEAAGAVVLRPAAGGGAEVLVVHRPKYDDWSLPKGKLDDGEKHEDAAVREVEEETGVLVELGDALDETWYHDRKGRVKRVRWWSARPLRGQPAGRTADAEIDDARWMPASEASRRLSYDRDRALLRDAVARAHADA